MFQNYFPTGFAKGIVHDGQIYTVESPIDVKAKRTFPGATLFEQASGHSIRLSQSCSTYEFQRFNFGLRNEKISQTKKGFILETYILPGGISEEGAPQDVITVHDFGNEVYRLLKRFYEDTHSGSLPQDIDKKYRTIESQIEARLVVAQTFDPRKYLGTIIKQAPEWIEGSFLGEEVQREMFEYEMESGEEINDRYDLFDRGGRRQTIFEAAARRTAKKILSSSFVPLEEKITTHAKHLEKGKRTDFPDENADAIKEFTRMYTNRDDAILYFSWDEEKPVSVMIPCSRNYRQGNGIVVKLNDKAKQPYKPVAEFSESEFNFLINFFSHAAVLNSIPEQKAKYTSVQPIAELFPMRMANGIIDMPNHSAAELAVKIRFPAYAMVDVESPDNVFLMPSGRADFTYDIRAGKQAELLKHKVIAGNSQRIYQHFFVGQQGSVCGFESIEDTTRDEENNRVGFSQIIWENYQLLHSTLTDGLKYDSGYVRIATMREELRIKPISIDGTVFDSRYVPREKIEQHNSKLSDDKKIHIGDGLIQ